MKLIPDWKTAHKLWSVRIGALTATVAGLDWLAPAIADYVPKWAYFALSVAVVVARLAQQEGLVPAADDPVTPDAKP